MLHGSWLKAHSWLMVHGQGGPAWPQGPGGAPTSSHEPWTINNRLLNRWINKWVANYPNNGISKQFKTMWNYVKSIVIPCSTIQYHAIPKIRTIPRCQFHDFSKILIPYSRFSRISKTNLEHVSARAFQNVLFFYETCSSPNRGFET